MATARIVIDTNAFAAGKPLYGIPHAKARVQIGNADTNNNINGGGIGVTYDASLADLVARASITVTVNALTVDTQQLASWPQNWKNSMADLVAKGVIIVESPAGSALTPSQIVSLTATGINIEDISSQVDVPPGNTTFTLSFPYSELEAVWLDGVNELQIPGAVTPSSPSTGVFTTSGPPAPGSKLVVEFRKA